MTASALDSLLASAVDLARAAALDVAPAEHVGDHVETVAEGEYVVTHHFGCTSPGYRGWRWAVTVARVPESDLVTVDDVVLLPGPDSLLAPQWVPWSERVRPGDLGPGDLYPTEPDDPRLEPGYTGSDALEADDETASRVTALRPEQWELGLGRERVLSAYGRDLAAERWYDELGPDTAMAKAAPGSCGTCGFLLPVGGLVGQAFGVCANAFGADGRVVALGYGCGAHSSVRPIDGTGVPVTDIVIDELVHHDLDLRSDPDASVLAVVVLDEVVRSDDDVVVVDRFADEPDASAVTSGIDADGPTPADEIELEVVAEDVVLVEDDVLDVEVEDLDADDLDIEVDLDDVDVIDADIADDDADDDDADEDDADEDDADDDEDDAAADGIDDIEVDEILG